MRKLIFIILLVSSGIQSFAQTYSYEVKMDNFQQISESEFQYDVFIRRGATSSDFALYMMQCRWSYNASLVNGGTFHNDYLTIVGGSAATGTQLYQKPGWFQDIDFTRISSTQLGWASLNPPGGGEAVTVIDYTWRKVCRFSCKLRNSGNTAFHNFADVDPQFAFELSGLNLIVRRCDGYTGTNPGATMVGEGNSEVPPAGRVVTPALGVPVNTRELAGYYFTGTANYSTAANWNNITTANYHTVPASANNAIITGSATITDTRVAKDVSVASGGYLVVAPGGKYTTNNLYNDNTGSGGGTVTVAKWDFQLATVGSQTPYPYTADDGISANKSIAPCQIFSALLGNYANFSSSGGTIAIRGSAWYDDIEEVFGFWQVQLSTTGYNALKINSKQYSVISGGPKSFKIQYSLNGTSWTDVTGGAVTVATNWTTGVVSNLSLPTALDNQSTVYIRWYCTDLVSNTGTSAIDDIIITGTTLPTGINIQSSSGGATGSLIHNNSGVQATVERYIAGNLNAYQGWHFLSSPADAQPISTFHTAGSGDDFYKWDETAADNLKWINRTATNGGLNGSFETNFQVGRGYLVAYRENSTKSFSGNLNVESVPLTGLTNTAGTYYAGWHLLGNPFASALKFNQGSWNRSNVSSISQIWNESTASYKVLLTAMEIPAMNGFMVYTTGNGSITIPADARVHSDSLWYKQAETADYLALIAEDPEGSTSQETLIRFDPQATDGFDFEMDSYYIAGFAPVFYSSSKGKYYALNTLSSMNDNLVIPIGFVKNDHSLFNIRLSRNIPGTRPILRDLKLNLDQDLAQNPEYHFSAESGDNANRFELRFTGVGLDEINSAPVSIFSKENEIIIRSLSGNALHGQVKIYNLLGQELKSQWLSDSPVTSIPLDAHQSHLIVKVLLDNQVCSEKVFLR